MFFLLVPSLVELLAGDPPSQQRQSRQRIDAFENVVVRFGQWRRDSCNRRANTYGTVRYFASTGLTGSNAVRVHSGP